MQVFCDQVAVAMERARLLQELETRNHELAEADKRKDEFLAMLGHELRNPLAPMVTALQLMRLRGDEDPTIVKAHNAMDRQLRHIVRLVDDLLDVSRINSARSSSASRPSISTRPRTCAGHQPAAHRRSRPCDARHFRRADPHPHVDPTRLSQVISNLLNNAAKYTPARGNIRAGRRSRGIDLAIRVRDDGIGLEEQELGHIFELFVQTHSSPDRGQGGLGIGLTLVKRLVELHGGRIEARSGGHGRGSEFCVTLPASSCPTPTTASPSASPPEAFRRRRRPSRRCASSYRRGQQRHRETLKDLLVMCGHEVEVAEDGESGVEMVLELKPNVALIDIGLPGLDGYRVARALRDRQPGHETRLIALTGYGQPDESAPRPWTPASTRIWSSRWISSTSRGCSRSRPT